MTIDGIVIRTNMAEKELICNSFSGKLRKIVSLEIYRLKQIFFSNADEGKSRGKNDTVRRRK